MGQGACEVIRVGRWGDPEGALVPGHVSARVASVVADASSAAATAAVPGCLLYYLCFFELPFEEQKLQIINGRYTIPADHSFHSGFLQRKVAPPGGGGLSGFGGASHPQGPWLQKGPFQN